MAASAASAVAMVNETGGVGLKLPSADKQSWIKHAQRRALLSQWGDKADPKKTDKELFLTKGTALDPMQTMLPSTTPHPTVLRFLLDETGKWIVVSPQPGMPSADFEQYQDVFPFYKDAIRGQCDPDSLDYVRLKRAGFTGTAWRYNLTRDLLQWIVTQIMRLGKKDVTISVVDFAVPMHNFNEAHGACMAPGCFYLLNDEQFCTERHTPGLVRAEEALEDKMHWVRSRSLFTETYQTYELDHQGNGGSPWGAAMLYLDYGPPLAPSSVWISGESRESSEDAAVYYYDDLRGDIGCADSEKCQAFMVAQSHENLKTFCDEHMRNPRFQTRKARFVAMAKTSAAWIYDRRGDHCGTTHPDGSLEASLYDFLRGELQMDNPSHYAVQASVERLPAAGSVQLYPPEVLTWAIEAKRKRKTFSFYRNTEGSFIGPTVVKYGGAERRNYFGVSDQRGLMDDDRFCRAAEPPPALTKQCLMTVAKKVADAARSFKDGDDAAAMKLALDDAMRIFYSNALVHLTCSFFDSPTELLEKRAKERGTQELVKRQTYPFQTGLAKTTTPAGCWKKVEQWLQMVEDFDCEARRGVLERPLQPLALNAFTLKLEPVEEVGDTLTEAQVKDMFSPLEGVPSGTSHWVQVVTKNAGAGWTMKKMAIKDAKNPIDRVKKMQRDLRSDPEVDRDNKKMRLDPEVDELERYTKDQCAEIDVKTMLKRKLKRIKLKI